MAKRRVHSPLTILASRTLVSIALPIFCFFPSDFLQAQEAEDPFLAPVWSSSHSIFYPSEELTPAWYGNFEPENYEHCRWGNFQSSETGPRIIWLGFTRLTRPPYDNSTQELFLTDERSLRTPATLNRLFFPEDPEPYWTEPNYAGNDNGSVLFMSNENANLFRKLHFPKTLGIGLSGNVDPTTQKLILVVHGWNPHSNADSFEESNFPDLREAISSATEGTDWANAAYHWELDSDTGGKDLAAAIHGTRAAEIGRLQGLRLGALLRKELPHLKKLQIICHSAGTWVGRECSRYLMLNPQADGPIQVQLTLLDPFVPDNVPLISSALNQNGLNRMVDNSLDGYDFQNIDSFFRLENYYAADEDLALGTSGYFEWRAQDVDGLQTHSPVYIPIGEGQVVTLWGNSYRNHEGPVQYYADSISALTESSPQHDEANGRLNDESLRVRGWKESLFWSEPLVTDSDFQNPVFRNVGQAIPSPLGSLTTKGLQIDGNYFDDTVNAPTLRYRWYKRNLDEVPEAIEGQDWISVTTQSHTIPFIKETAEEGDEGVYGIIIQSSFHLAPQIEFFDLINLVLPRTPVISDGLVGWWEFDKNFLDISGHENHGITYPSGELTFVKDRFGKPGRAMLLKGNAFVRVLDRPSIRVGEHTAIAFWMQTKPLAGYEPCTDFIPLLKSSEQNQLIFIQTKMPLPDRLVAEMPFHSHSIGGYSDNAEAPTAFKPAAWTFVALTNEVGSLNLFVNGQRQKLITWASTATVPDAGTNDDLFFGFGGARDDSGEYLPRTLDSMRIWNRPLSAKEIWKLYKGDAPVDSSFAYPTHPDYSLWMKTHAPDSLNNAFFEDADGDGVSNLAQYSFTTEGGGPQDLHLPVLETTISGETCLKCIRRTSEDNIRFTVETSENMLQWKSVVEAMGNGALTQLPGAGGATVIESEVDGGKEATIVIPSSASSTNRLFLKVRVDEITPP